MDQWMDQWMAHTEYTEYTIPLTPVHTTIGCRKQGFPSAQPYLSQYYERGQNIPEPSGACRFMGDGC